MGCAAEHSRAAIERVGGSNIAEDIERVAVDQWSRSPVCLRLVAESMSARRACALDDRVASSVTRQRAPDVRFDFGDDVDLAPEERFEQLLALG